MPLHKESFQLSISLVNVTKFAGVIPYIYTKSRSKKNYSHKRKYHGEKHRECDENSKTDLQVQNVVNKNNLRDTEVSSHHQQLHDTSAYINVHVCLFLSKQIRINFDRFMHNIVKWPNIL